MGGGLFVAVLRSVFMLAIKRFKPQCGLDRDSIEEEARTLASEIDLHLLDPQQELREQLGQCGDAWNKADEALHAVVLSLPDCERLVVQWLLVCDQHRVLEVYLECLRSRQSEAPALPVQTETPAPPIKVEVSTRQKEFNESLFPT